ncbi:MAG: tetraacyldisaccharide 4'-kinase [Labilithrix sp.]|nr:tetraacyldisaccharide 4'-kinase [Labilithrix sp.]
MSLSRGAARALETGRWDGLVARAIASAFAPVAARGIVRQATVPQGIALVCVGGATLGGSGKTRVAIACARELAAAGARVALVGHAYRADPTRARVVVEGDRVDEVGDEALVCARALARWAVPIVVGPTRQAAIDRALLLDPVPEVLVLDGPLALRGSPARSLSLLAVDAHRPWGVGRLPPAGDLRAPRDVLLSRADHVVPVDATPAVVRWRAGEGPSLAELRSTSVGLFTAIARPDRLVRALASVGVHPRAIVSVADHGAGASVGPLLRGAEVDAWLATAKCALHLADVPLRVPLGVVDAEPPLPSGVLAALRALRRSSFE